MDSERARETSARPWGGIYSEVAWRDVDAITIGPNSKTTRLYRENLQFSVHQPQEAVRNHSPLRSKSRRSEEGGRTARLTVSLPSCSSKFLRSRLLLPSLWRDRRLSTTSQR